MRLICRKDDFFLTLNEHQLRLILFGLDCCPWFHRELIDAQASKWDGFYEFPANPCVNRTLEVQVSEVKLHERRG